MEEGTVTLADLKPGDVARIEAFESGALDAKAMRRFREMGLTRGTGLRMIRRAPLDDPIEISVRGALLSIRGENAIHILVSKQTDKAGKE